MKEKDLLNALGEVDDKFIAEAAPDTAEHPDYTEIIPRKEPFYMKILPIVACLAFVGVGITAGVLIKNTALNPAYKKQGESSYQPDIYISSAPANNSSGSFMSSVSEGYRVPHWDELEINGQYTSFEWQGCGYMTSGSEISAEKLGWLLGETTASGVDQYTDEKHEITVSVCPINKISEKTALAVQFPEDEKFYVYFNRNYKPETLGDFIDDINLTENLKISTTATCSTIENGYMTNWEYSDIDASKFMEILLSGRNVPTESMFDYNTFAEGDRFEAALNFAVDIPILGIKNLSLEITKGGFVHTNAFFHTSMLFYLGKDKTDSFVQYVKENCPSEKTRQSDESKLQEIEAQKQKAEEQNEIVSLFKNLAYIECDLYPDIFGYFPDCVDRTAFITEEIVEQSGYPDKASEQNFYLVKNITEEEFKEKLLEIFTEDAAQDYLTTKQDMNLLRFKDGKLFVAQNEYSHDLDFCDGEAAVVIALEEILDDGFTVTVTASGDDFVRQKIKLVQGADGKPRIADSINTFDDIQRLRFKNAKVNFVYKDRPSSSGEGATSPAYNPEASYSPEPAFTASYSE